MFNVTSILLFIIFLMLILLSNLGVLALTSQLDIGHCGNKTAFLFFLVINIVLLAGSLSLTQEANLGRFVPINRVQGYGLLFVGKFCL